MSAKDVSAQAITDLVKAWEADGPNGIHRKRWSLTLSASWPELVKAIRRIAKEYNS